ncbi:hypothetical protein GCM10017562_74240 [Streptomyces roseofulvus]|uniref:hypothetical protein n=1 Tax=Streptomyces roseofulvus TaxID=33902 RepID=UPI0031FC218A
MPLITTFSTNVRPDRRLVEVHDSDAYLGSDEAWERSRTQVWDTPQQPPEDAEGTVPVSLESETGQLVIMQLTFGPAGEMDLPRPGVYDGHAAWKGREAAASYNTRIKHAAEQQGDAGQLGAAWRQCPTTEQYTLDLWFVRESEPEDDWDA